MEKIINMCFLTYVMVLTSLQNKALSEIPSAFCLLHV
jgi:hypothetical protein